MQAKQDTVAVLKQMMASYLGGPNVNSGYKPKGGEEQGERGDDEGH